jgi:type II secretory pathway pseudopilin PulG
VPALRGRAEPNVPARVFRLCCGETLRELLPGPAAKVENMPSRKQHGYSMLELVIVIVIIFIISGVTFIGMSALLQKNQVDQAYDRVLSVLLLYRNKAIMTGNRYIIVPSAPGTITVQFWGYSPPPATSPAPVTVATYTLPPNIQFSVQSGFPNPGPDGFGNGGSAIFFNACTVVESGDPCLIFYPNGSVQDDLGNYNSGVVYITNPALEGNTNFMTYNSRAIDVFGASGRIRGWRLYNVSGTYTWEQQ